MTIFALLTSIALAGAPEAGPAANGALQKSGLYGWGLGFEGPAVGVMTGLAAHSKVGWGYILSGALSYEITPVILARLYVGGGQTYDGRAPIRYIPNVQTSPDERVTSKLKAEWAMAELGLGGAYLFRSPDRTWAPYVGLDARFRFGGYDFHFNDSVKALAAVDATDPNGPCSGVTCATNIHDAIGLNWGASLRGGVRLDLTSWLMAEPELALTYTRSNADPVSNTVENRDVRGVAENVLLVAATFSVRVGL